MTRTPDCLHCELVEHLRRFGLQRNVPRSELTAATLQCAADMVAAAGFDMPDEAFESMAAARMEELLALARRMRRELRGETVQ